MSWLKFEKILKNLTFQERRTAFKMTEENHKVCLGNAIFSYINICQANDKGDKAE